MFTKIFLLDAVERAVKTAAQAVLSLVTTNVTGITDLDLTQVGSVAALAVVVSLLTSVVSYNRSNPNASLAVESEKHGGV